MGDAALADRYLPVPTSACLTEVDQLGWATTVPLRAGGHVLGVRVGTPEVAELVRTHFADRLEPDATPPPNLSLFLAPRARSGPRGLHRLYVNFSPVARARSAIRAFDALWHEVELRDVEASASRVQLHAAVFVDGDGGAHLLAGQRRRALVDEQRRWAATGLRFVDRRVVDLDVECGTVTVRRSGLAPNHGQLGDRLRLLGIDHRDEAPAPEGTFTIASWQLPAGTLAEKVLAAAGQVGDRAAHDGVALIEGLAQLLARLPDVGVPTG